MKEKILETLNNLGFSLTEVGTLDYAFKYEGINFLYMYNENDENFLNLSIPGIYDLDKENILKYYTLCEKINSTLKYIKAYTLNDALWLFYERELFENDDLEGLLSRMINQLTIALLMVRNTILEMDGDETTNDNN